MATATRLFDYVVVVALRPTTSLPPTIKPSVRYRFPQQVGGRTAETKEARAVAEEERKLYKAAKQFCFPDLPPALLLTDYMAPTGKATAYSQQNETFSFTLTESDGAKRWGYCRRTPGPHYAHFPQCICIISFLPCFSIFSTILRELASLQRADPIGFDAFTIFLDAIYREPLPPGGGTLRVAIPLERFPKQVAQHLETANAALQTTPTAPRLTVSGTLDYAFTRPDDSESLLDHVDFEPLLHFLDASHIASILTSLLVERRMIFVATNLNTLSSCVQAAASVREILVSSTLTAKYSSRTHRYCIRSCGSTFSSLLFHNRCSPSVVRPCRSWSVCFVSTFLSLKSSLTLWKRSVLVSQACSLTRCALL